MRTSRTALRRTRGPRERGSAAIEAAIGVPAFLLFVAMIIAAGRLAIAHSAVESAAADAARSASLARTQQAARTDGSKAGAASLVNQSLQCKTSRIHVDASEFATPVGQPATVQATVTCWVNLSDVALPGLPGTQKITATMKSPLDTYRER